MRLLRLDAFRRQVFSARLRSMTRTSRGVVNHMRWVEHSWVENRFVDGPDLGPWTDESPDQEFIDGASAPLTQVLRDSAVQAERTDEIMLSTTWTTGPRFRSHRGSDPR